MQVTKPQALGLSTRPVEFRKRFGLCISATLHLQHLLRLRRHQRPA